MEKKVKNKQWETMLIIVSMTFMSTLDGSIVNVALPVMTKALAVTNAQIQFVSTSYLIVIAGIILIFGNLGDRIGKSKVFLFGIFFFTFGSFLCGLAHSFPFLIFARVVQGIGSAATMANSQGIVTETVSPQERGKALGIVGTAVALGSLVGPGLGGLIVGVASWEYIFWINVPIGAIVFFAGLKILPESIKMQETDEKKTVDVAGSFTFLVAIVSLFISLNAGLELGFTNPMILFGFAIAAVGMVVFLFLEKRAKNPLVDLTMFTNKLFSLSIFCGYISFVALFCHNIILPFFLQDVRKYSPGISGLILMTYPLLLSVAAPISGHLSDKLGSEKLTFAGLVLISLGLFSMSTLNEHSPVLLLLLFIAIMAIGNGLFQSPNNSLVMSTVPRSKLGIAGSINSLIRNVGMVSGIALSTTILYGTMSSKLGYRVTDYVAGKDNVFVYGMRVVYITAGCICLVGAALTFWRMVTVPKEDW